MRPVNAIPAAYTGRFAPSPTGPLHAGSLATALASRLDALAHRGRWLLRIEDVDAPRCTPAAAEAIVASLQATGFRWNAEPVVQSRRGAAYRAAFDRLVAAGNAYPCACTRKEIADSVLRAGDAPARHAELVYPGTCRDGLPPGRTARAWRLRVPPGMVAFDDRCAGRIEQDVARDVGDFVLLRADGLWAYQLAVVVDDAEAGVTDVVRGADLLGSTPRQIVLQRLSGLPVPRYLHVPVVTDAHGEKLSKQTGAVPIDDARPLEALRAAAAHLGLGEVPGATVEAFWLEATARWAAGYGADRAAGDTAAWRGREGS